MRIITLLTDFGTDDPWVGVMKGVIYSITSEVEIIDITHGVPPGNVVVGAFFVDYASRYFPKDTIHVVVVDPGVGSDRRPIMVSARGQYFIGPDNGVFTPLYNGEESVYHLTSSWYFRTPVSNTFHGRDIFAPVAAHLSTGLSPEFFGERIEDYKKIPLPTPRKMEDGTIEGEVIHVDRFGNLVTNISKDMLEGYEYEIDINGKVISGIKKAYNSVPPGEPLALIDSFDMLEIAVNRGSAAKILGCKQKTQVRVRRKS